ncbi:hypothetical protein [Ruegeria lacuscaerulensis]|uniref:hypothetical protein n=1 Tax=Ruegeria lacuscaerulensis TaxID=55218 RepID=UPI00147B8339|nr:hypothetical protein [Ruegeria lacuscaerulensis]
MSAYSLQSRAIRYEPRQIQSDNQNTPPRRALRDCPIVALHWFGVDLNGGAS